MTGHLIIPSRFNSSKSSSAKLTILADKMDSKLLQTKNSINQLKNLSKLLIKTITLL